jgi:hypothetical protein
LGIRGYIVVDVVVDARAGSLHFRGFGEDREWVKTWRALFCACLSFHRFRGENGKGLSILIIFDFGLFD